MATATKKAPSKKPKPLTPRERRLLAVLPEAKTLKEALITAGYSEKTADKMPTPTINNVLGKIGGSPILKAFEAAGINDELIAQKHREGLEAYKVISAKVVEKGAGAADNDFIEVPDFATRHKYLDTQHKIRADFPKEQVEVSAEEGFATILANALSRAQKAKGE